MILTYCFFFFPYCVSVDLYLMFKIVKNLGGYHQVNISILTLLLET